RRPPAGGALCTVTTTSGRPARTPPSDRSVSAPARSPCACTTRPAPLASLSDFASDEDPVPREALGGSSAGGSAGASGREALDVGRVSSRRNRARPARSAVPGRVAISTGAKATWDRAENENCVSAADGPITDTAMPRSDSPAASILTCVPIPPADVPRTSVTRSSGGAPLMTARPGCPLRPGRPPGPGLPHRQRRPAPGDVLGSCRRAGAEAGQGAADVAAVEAEDEGGAHA